MTWDAHAEHVRTMEEYRERMKYVVGKHVGHQLRKHEAVNWKTLKETYEEAREKCPRAADTIAWMLWWDIANFERLALLTKPEDEVDGSST